MAENYLHLLRLAVWEKAIGTPEIVYEDHYFRHIASKISNDEEVLISRIKNSDSIHWETIKGFFNNGTRTRKDTLDILSWYVIGGGEITTYENFKTHVQQKKKKRIPFLWIILILVSATIAALVYKAIPFKTENKYFEEDFSVPASDIVSYIEKKGWKVNEKWDSLLHSQLRDSVLTLYTFGGGYWAPDFDRGGNKGFIRNLVYREISGSYFLQAPKQLHNEIIC